MLSYRPLKQEQSEIRLVRFKFASDLTAHDSEAGGTSIRLELRHASLDDSTTRYAALSYAWGDAKSHQNEIYVDDSIFRIGRNLHDGLSQLRRMGVSSWLWIDSICIQQSDIEEKTWQVRLMRPVFSQAEMVYIWLGPGSAATDRAMDYISRVGPRALSAGAIDLYHRGPGVAEIRAKCNSFGRGGEGRRENQEWSELIRFIIDLYEEKGLHSEGQGCSTANGHILYGIAKIMLKDYWHRIWIIQEIALAREATIICGVKSSGLDEFDAFMTAIQYCWGIELDSWGRSHNTFAAGLSPSFYNSTAMFTRHFHQRGWNGEEIELADILVQHDDMDRPHYSATDPRDIVFGILGLVSEDQRLGLVVDYGLTAAQVFCKLTKALYRQADEHGVGPKRFHLDTCIPKDHEDQRADDQTPTWVPDWVRVGKYGVRVTPINYLRLFDAAAATAMRTKKSGTATQHSQLEDDDLRLLRRRGCVVDTITAVMDPPIRITQSERESSRIVDTQAWLSSIIKFTELGPEVGPAEDYVWRTIMKGYVRIYGLNRGDKTLDEQTAAVFRKIMRREPIDTEQLSTEQKEYIRHGAFNLAASRPDRSLDDHITNLKELCPFLIGNANCGRTLFKTAKAMLGTGHVAIRRGDIVTLMEGLGSPIILRPRDEDKGGGFTFVGDAYVDGIMHGEFLQTQPTWRDFDIY